MDNTNVKINDAEVMASTRKFGLRDKLGYLFCEFGDDLLFYMSVAYLMVFYTDVMGLSPVSVGAILMAGKIWDAIADVAIGRYIDSRNNSENGRFAPLIIRFGPILAISTVLMFAKIPGLSDNANFIYALLTYILWGTLYSCVTIPYGALASVITSDPVGRASLSTFRSMGSTIGRTATLTIVPMFIFVNGKASGERFFMVSIILAVLAMICYFVSYKSITERVFMVEKTNKPKTNILAAFKALGKNKPFLCITGVSIVSICSLAISGAMKTYLYKDYFHNTAAMSIGGMIGLLNLIILAPTIAPITKKFGKKEAVSAAFLISTILYLILFFVPIHNAFLFVALNYIANLGNDFFGYVLWAFVTDVIDYQEYITEDRQDGTVYAMFSFTRKVSQAVSGGLGAFALGAIGYVAKAPAQTAEVALKIKNLAILTPVVSFFIIFLIFKFLYPMTQEALTEIQDELERRRTAK